LPKWAVVAAIAILFLAVPPLAHIPARLIAGCATWIALAGLLELLSMLGFVVVFKLVFGARMSRRQGLAAGLRALGASTVLPAGGLIGPAIGARSRGSDDGSLARLTRSAVAFVIVTNVPGMIVLAALGLSLGLGWPDGPHEAALTLPAGGVALAVLAAGWLARRPSSSTGARVTRASEPRTARSQIVGGFRLVCEGLGEARHLLRAGNWKLVGALAYYAFDNAVLWAAFRAYGHTPPLSIIVMGYLVGSLSTALPVPGGLGAVEGGLIGALVLYGAPAAPAAGAVLLYRGISLSLPVALSACAWAFAPGTIRRPARPRRSRRESPRALRTRRAPDLAPAPVD
jgi:uncharacterized membrane protein YbhN (UPF0104 family)